MFSFVPRCQRKLPRSANSVMLDSPACGSLTEVEAIAERCHSEVLIRNARCACRASRNCRTGPKAQWMVGSGGGLMDAQEIRESYTAFWSCGYLLPRHLSLATVIIVDLAKDRLRLIRRDRRHARLSLRKLYFV